MPYGTRRKVYRKKTIPGRVRRRYTRRNKRYVRRAPAMGVPSGMPLVRTAKMRYCSNSVITCTPTAVGWVDLRANSINDPEYAAGGQRPMGYSNWASLYDQYVVVGSKVTAYLSYQTQGEASSDMPICVGCYLSDDGVVPWQDWRGFVEAKKGTYRNMTAYQDKPVKIVSKFSARKFFNVVDPLDNIGRIGALMGTDPTESALWIIWGSVTGSPSPTDTVKVNVNIVIDYIVKFSEPKDLARST